MAAASVLVLLSVLVFCLVVPSIKSAACNSFFTFNNSIVNFTTCASLPAQSASLAWTFFSNNNTLNIAFAGTAASASGWVGWGINPVSKYMVESSVLIAFPAHNGSNLLPYKLTTEVQLQTTPLVCSPVDLIIKSTAVEISGTSMSMFATLQLPNNKTVLNHVWNKGSAVTNFQPMAHSLDGDGILGFETLDMYTAQATGAGQAPNDSLKRAHGIINTISWGILLPIGVIIARYLRPFPSADPIWFYIHASLQTAGYILGVTGWALGMKLRTLSAFIHYSHQNIGISLFVLATLQSFSLFLRPSPDQKIRKYWNVYHHTLGYTIILLAIINIFQGLNILQPGGGWRAGYIGSLCLMAVLCVVLEAATWIRFFYQRM